MQSNILENQEAEPLDDATHEALDEAEAAYERGEIITLEQSDINLRNGIEAWQKAQQKKPLAA